MKTMFTLLLIGVFSITILPNFVLAQKLTPQVTASAGDHFVLAGTASLDWTLGEVVVETFSQTPYILTQGFHQPDLGIVSSWHDPDIQVDIKAFPNPTSDWITVETNDGLPRSVEMIDLTGRLLFRAPLYDNQSLYLGDLPSGLYLLRVLDGKKIIKVFRIVKSRI